MRQEKTFCLSKEYHMDGTGTSERNIYLSAAHVTPRKSLHLSALAP